MLQNIKKFIYEPKSKIGWAHGLLVSIFAIICANLTMSVFIAFYEGDFAQRIIPSMIITPILMMIYGLWFLFSKSIINLLKKAFFSLILLIALLILFLKVL